jgi:hypothetical protein
VVHLFTSFTYNYPCQLVKAGRAFNPKIQKISYIYKYKYQLLMGWCLLLFFRFNYYISKPPIPLEKVGWGIYRIKNQVSQVTSGPRRGPTFNNRWWNDRRSWNLRTTNSREKASPKGANRIQSCPCSPPLGTVREYLSLSAGSIPFGHSTRGYSHSPPSFTFAPGNKFKRIG